MEPKLDAAGNPIPEETPGSGSTTPPASGSGNQPGTGNTPTDEWQKRALGWQRAHGEVKGLLDSTTGELSVEKAARIALAAEKATAEEKRLAAEKEAQTKGTQLDRLTMVMTEFPELIPFVKDGILPEGTGDELRAKLTTFKTHLSTIIGSQGTTPSGSNGTPGSPIGIGVGNMSVKADDIKKKAFAAAAAGNRDEYNKYMTEYMAATKKSE